MEKVLYLDAIFDFSNIGVNSFDDAKLLNDIMSYIEEGYYDLVVFPYNKTFIIKPSHNKECNIFNTSVNKGIVTTDKNYFRKGNLYKNERW